MRIEELLLRTMKSDQNPNEGKIDYYMQRAGFMKKVNGMLAYTTAGILLKNRIEGMIVDILKKESFSRIGFSGVNSLLELEKTFHSYNDFYVGSYKDIPLKLYVKDQISYREENHASLWRGNAQNIIGFSMLGVETDSDELMVRIFRELGIEAVEDQKGYYYPSISGQEEYCAEDESGDHSARKEKDGSPESLMMVKTPGTKTIHELCLFLEAKPSDILKTMLLTDGVKTYAVVLEGHREMDLARVNRILGLKEDALKVLPSSQVTALTGAEVGFAGPMNLRVDQILVDEGVSKKKAYIAGANQTDYHYKGMKYGRDFSGDFYSVTRREKTSKGWLLGEIRNQPEKIRVQAQDGGFDYHPLSVAYLNVDRLILAVAETSMDEIGLNLSKETTCFDAVVALVDPREERGITAGSELYEILSDSGLRVLLDDRKDRMGSKFSDYDLLGIPKRVIVGRDGNFDVKDRNGSVTKTDKNNIVEIIRS
ncbi:YbaK/EbsC family protein [Proteiniclasticum sp. C24MP]|uniref:YbaK/EbsC family protein n=1 Tax=Proteiniclasticum sp. C24MP TaxID=3374101 RepID=UPI0037551A02